MKNHKPADSVYSYKKQKILTIDNLELDMFCIFAWKITSINWLWIGL